MKKKLIIAGLLAVILVLALIFLRLSFCPLKRAKPSTESSGRPPERLEAMLKRAADLEAQGELLRARGAYRDIFLSYAAAPGVENVQKRLEDVNTKILYSAIDIPGETAVREVRPGDSLFMIAEEFHTTPEFIKKQNGLSSDVIRPGMRLRIWTGTFSVAVDKSQNLLTLKSNGEFVRTYRVATGKSNITPVGNFKITSKLIRPSWTHGGRVIPPESPENILGTRWLGFDIPGYGIHGTTEPQSIGTQATAGCVRMLNNEVEELYDLLPRGTEVTIID